MEMKLEEVTIAEAMKEAGYTTFFAGKWHLGHEGHGPEDQGYDVNKGGHIAGTPPGGYFLALQQPGAARTARRARSFPVRLGRETAKFIGDHKDKPFFAMLSFYSVHGPIQCSETRWRKYRDKAERMGLIDRADPRFRLDRTKEVRQAQDHPVYAGMMEAMDEGVGHAIKALDEHGLADNTIVIFTSDNGGVSSGDGFATSCLPLRGGKGRQWEGGVRQPYYIKWPGVTSGTRTDVPATGTDFYPTILDIAGLLPDRISTSTASASCPRSKGAPSPIVRFSGTTRTMAIRAASPRPSTSATTGNSSNISRTAARSFTTLPGTSGSSETLPRSIPIASPPCSRNSKPGRRRWAPASRRRTRSGTPRPTPDR